MYTLKIEIIRPNLFRMNHVAKVRQSASQCAVFLILHTFATQQNHSNGNSSIYNQPGGASYT